MIRLSNRIFIRLIAASVILCAGNICAQKQTLPLIPLPEKIEYLYGNFTLSNYMEVSGAEGSLQEYFLSQMEELTGFELKPTASASSRILFNISNWKMEKEEYRLCISRNNVLIAASTREGLFRGMQTFFQLIPDSIKAEKKACSFQLPCVNIYDKPRFGHRGLTLDCSRQFLSKEFIKRYIDILAYYKFNTFHWHLTDDQGWRIEIDSYSKLTKIGSVRREADGLLHGGLYTREDIKEIVAYAQSRYINIIPEIEMPGHVRASLAAYPDNSCAETPLEMTNIMNVFKDVYCAGDNGTYRFIENILDDVCELFPGRYIHIGGNDVCTDAWKSCETCQDRIKRDSLRDENGLKSYFFNRVASYLAAKEKEAIIWDDSTRQSISSDIIVEQLTTEESITRSIKEGHKVICAPASYTSLDQDAEFLSLKKIYSFEPVPSELTEKEAKRVLGGEAVLWTERVSQGQVDNKLFPRMLALAEVFWSDPKQKDYEDFYVRTQMNYRSPEEFNREEEVAPVITDKNFDRK